MSVKLDFTPKPQPKPQPVATERTTPPPAPRPNVVALAPTLFEASRPTRSEADALTPATAELGKAFAAKLRSTTSEAVTALGGLEAKPKDLSDFLDLFRTGDDTIAIFDDFDGTHGGNVEDVVEDNTTTAHSHVREVDIDGTDGPQGTLDERIVSGAIGLLDGTSDAMENLLADPGNVSVINQSQSVSPVRVVDNMWNEVQGSDEKKADLAEELGLPRDSGDKEILQSLVDRVEKQFAESPELKEAKARYDDLSNQLEDAGILHVVTAGNTGDRVDMLDELGVNYSDSFTNSVLFNDDTIVVGASTGGKNDRIADFSTPSDYVTVAIDGTDIPVGGGETADGTSFSAPQVTALIAEMRRINPDLTNDQVRDILERSATDTKATDREEGAGILQPEQALLLTRLSLLKDIPFIPRVA